ncbi:MAG TPA: chromosome segregation protein SMC [Thermoplasmata archaeon]|nr:chromosome segregation protein SMC [Thermoplasmata archaeon]
MHLKRLKVRNFKSFAGATEIPFQPGFTGVAGPNGMGKSNISDAILFVLGPTSSKALRADRLTHLFFNGGSSKKPATECEVSLVFDNSDRLLPSDNDEVEITRYVKLAPSDPDGYYSYFYINGRRSTQGEIDSVLSHARLSGDGYNLVQQGDVNRIVSMGPIPRRGLVERLAGISQYDDDLARAQSKRTDLEGNLAQIQTLLGEIRSHLQSLESQRTQAIQYKQLQDEKRRNEARLARADLLLARHEVESGQALLAKVTAEIGELQKEATRLEAERDRLDGEIQAAEKEIAARAGPAGQKFSADLNEKRVAFGRLDQNYSNVKDDLEQVVEKLTALAADLKSSRSTVSGLERQEKELAARLKEIEQAVRKSGESVKEAASGAEKSQGKLSDLRQKVLVQERVVEKRTGEWKDASQALEGARATLSASEHTTAVAEEDERTRELELRDLELRVRESRPTTPKGGRASSDLQQELFQLKAREKNLHERTSALSGEVLELNRRYMALDARLKARADSNPRAGSAAAVDYLLSLRNLGKISGIRGTVEELARFDAEHHTAITVAAGNRFQSLVVETDQVAEECIQLLRQEKRGRATFLPLNKMLAGRPRGKSLIVAQSSGAVGFAVDLVKFDEALRPAFWYVLGETVVMKDLARAREQMGGVRLVTLGGELIEATGAITGGFLETGEKARGGDNALELRRVGEELRRKSEEESAARTELDTLQNQLRELAEELAKRSGQAQAQGSAVKLLEVELAAAKDRLKEARDRVGAAHKAVDAATQALEAAQKKVTALETSLTEAKAALSGLNEEYFQQLPGSISSKFRSLQEASEKAAREQLEAASQLESIRAQLTAARAQLAERESSLRALEADRAAADKQLATLDKQRAAAQEELEKLKGLEAEQLKAVQGQTEAKRRLETQRIQLIEGLARTSETLRTRRAMEQTEEVHLATAQRKVAEMEEAVKAFPEEAAEEPTVPLDELRRSIQTLTAQLEAFGPVNLRALEEYDAEKARLDQFESEVNRLTTEKSELVGLVGEIEKKKRTKLVEVVTAVNVAYTAIYSDLSSGGEGEIALENPDDPLAGGLLIRARPVGKVIQRLEQLSGGEKSLASLAFVFALQRYDPSPLYVFDEVDMSLDGVNAENVGRMLRRNAERAQFIVISLRKVTLKFAHRLFGVTMHGDGCSRVVGLGLDEIVDVDERERPEPHREPRAPEVAA